MALHSAAAAVFEDEVIDRRDVVSEVEGKAGKLTPAVERNVRNRRTGKYFTFSECWGAQVTNYRLDLWKAIDTVPDAWDDLIRAGPPAPSLFRRRGPQKGGQVRFLVPRQRPPLHDGSQARSR